MGKDTKINPACHVVIFLLVPSIIANIFFILRDDEINLWRGQWQLSWSRRAAVEAEYVAAISCSGHGKAYLDGSPSLLDGNKSPPCECNTCFGGPDCSQILPGCVVNVDSGNPYFLEPFWTENAESSAVLLSGWHRMGYASSSMVTEELEKHIRELHEIVGNAVTKERFIVFGVGSIQLLNAAVHALSPQNSSSPARVVVSVPYYGTYKSQTDYFESMKFKFGGEASLWKNNSDANNTNLIELVTSPNNPDGQLKKSVLHGPNVKAIYDRVYYWPHFTAIDSAPANEEVMLFSLSKLTGHAGSRFGWAVVKDEEVYQRMLTHVSLNTIGISREAQLRALQLVKVALQGNGKEIFKFGYKTLSSRWEKLNETLSVSSRFSLQKLGAQYCSFFQAVRGPSPGYAWLKCEREEDKDCYAVLEEANIMGRRGSVFGAEERYVRLSLVRSQDDFDLMIHQLNKLVSQEYNPKLILEPGTFVSES